MARYVVFILAGLALWGIGQLSLTPLIIAGDRGLLVRGIGAGLILVWLGLGWMLGIWFHLWYLLTGGPAKDAALAVRQDRGLEAPDFAAAERLHGALAPDIEALYGSKLRLDRNIALRSGEDVEMLVERFLAPHVPYSNPFFPALETGRWMAIAEDGFGNVYAARTDGEEKKDGATPLYFFDHEVGGEPAAIGLSVRDLLTRRWEAI